MADVEAGNRADDPLYISSYQRTKQLMQKSGLLVVGDSKMSSLTTRATIVAGQDMYLTPLKDESGLLASLLDEWLSEGAKSTPVFLPADQPGCGTWLCGGTLPTGAGRGPECGLARTAAGHLLL